MTTIASIAADYNLQAHEVAASLDITAITVADTDTLEQHGWTDTDARTALDALAEQADRA